MNLLTWQEKEALRSAPCDRCGKIPPFKDGSRCHVHRVMPGHLGGQYTKENTDALCPRCHDVVHGGDGRQRQRLIGSAHLGGKISDSRPGGIASSQARLARWRREGLSPAELAQRRSPELCQQRSVALLGHSVSQETRAKISIANKGRPSPMKGRRHTVETKAKISAAKRGVRTRQDYTVSPRTRRKISQSLRKRYADGYEQPGQPKTRGAHVRWHVRRDVQNWNCEFCRDGSSV